MPLPRPPLASAVTSAFKVSLPLARGGSTMSVSYAVDFAALLLLGPHETMLVARRQRVEPVHVPDGEQEPAVPHALQHGVPGHHRQAAGFAYLRARRRARARWPARWPASPVRWSAAATDVLRLQHAARSRSPSGSDLAPAAPQRLERRTSCGARPSYFVGAGWRAAVATWALDDLRASGSRCCAIAPLYLTYRTYKVYLGPHRRRAAARRGDGRPAPGHHRGAGAGHRRQGSDRADAHPPRAGVRGGPGARARHDRQRDPGREDRRPAARHRQARRARAHPVQARTADARKSSRRSAFTRRSAPRSSAPCRSRTRWRRSS